MKICEFTQYDLHAHEQAAIKKSGRKDIIVLRTPTERAIQLLLLTLETVNKAGLDGKELSDLTLVQRYEPGAHYDDQKIEIHAKVRHRVKP